MHYILINSGVISNFFVQPTRRIFLKVAKIVIVEKVVKNGIAETVVKNG